MLLCPRNSPGNNTGVGCHSLLQGIFPTQESNPSLLHCRQILYPLSHQESPKLENRHGTKCEQGSRTLFRNKRARQIGFRVFLCLLSKEEFYFGLKIIVSQDCFLLLLLLKHISYFTNYSQASPSWQKAEWVEGRDRHWREINALELKSPGTFRTWLFPWDFIHVLYSLHCKS